MDIKELQKHIRDLAGIEETKQPMVSCYLNLENGKSGCLRNFLSRVEILRKGLERQLQPGFNKAIGSIDEYLNRELEDSTKGAAIFSRYGKKPYFLPMQFRVPVRNEVIVDGLPSVYGLVELKDVFHQFIIVVSNESHGKILEVNLGEVTEAIFTEKPELRKRVGREWTKEHYQNHRRDRGERFVKEKIKILEQLIQSKGYSHLILAGKPHLTSRLKKSLPKHLLDKLIDTEVHTNTSDLGEVINASLKAFIDEEQKESEDMLQKLKHSIATDGLALLGPAATLDALQMGQVDALIMSKDFDHKWIREELVRTAVEQGIHIETVPDDPMLKTVNGVACLLRYKLPGEHSL
ncbi:MAG: hypothetical protein AAGA18_06930 [Verrucomicrobiota bacterium]